MRLWRRLLRILGYTGLAALMLLLLAFITVHIQQYVFRHRAERLLADFHAIRLKHSTWQDAQRLISRWGAFGHYDGTCTQTECSYFVTLEDAGSRIGNSLNSFMAAHWPEHDSFSTFGLAFIGLGGRPGYIRMGFLVEDNIIQRSSFSVMVFAPSDNALFLNASASDHLKAYEEERPIAGDEEQITSHLDFKEDQPGACEGCMGVDVTFTPNINQQELKRITSYNFACFTSFHVCQTLPELLPAAADWNLYPSIQTEPFRGYYDTEKPCQVPVFALARDALAILVVDVVNTQILPEHKGADYPNDRDRQQAEVRLVHILKGTQNPNVSTSLNVFPFAGEYDQPLYRLENLAPGRRYILFPYDWPTSPDVETPHCGIVEASPQIESEIQRGMALNDNLRAKRIGPDPLW